MIFDPVVPEAPGTDPAPIPFASRSEFSFRDGEGRTVCGSVASSGKGRTFHLALDGAPRQRALRSAAFQVLGAGGTCFRGAKGIVCKSSAAAVSPHATSTLYLVRLRDCGGRCRSRLGG